MIRKAYLVIVLLGLTVLAYGCAAATGAAAGVGTYAWSAGKTSFSTPNSVSQTHDAVLSAFDQLGIRLTQDQTSRLGGTITGVTTETNDEVTIDLEPQGADVTKIDIRVGFFGDQGRSEKIADAIKQRLG